MLGLKKLNVSKSFETLLKEEFLSDLEAAAVITHIPPRERTSHQHLILNSLKRKYGSTRSCPSNLFPYAPNSLQEEYYHIHNKINSLLSQ